MAMYERFIIVLILVATPESMYFFDIERQTSTANSGTRRLSAVFQPWFSILPEGGYANVWVCVCMCVGPVTIS